MLLILHQTLSCQSTPLIRYFLTLHVRAIIIIQTDKHHVGLADYH